MTSGYYPNEEDWLEEEWPGTTFAEPIAQGGTLPVEAAVLLAAILVALVLGWAALGVITETGETAVVRPRTGVESESETVIEQPFAPLLADATAVIAPYEEYIVTQGVHGLSYGHMAIDIAAGKGAAIRSPINGAVSDRFFDAIGNPTLVIENERYKVTLLHGIYTVEVGDKLNIGDPIGVESNLGNTRDMQGVSCRNRDCGYHTHLNIFDKIGGGNINPLDVVANWQQ